jgi:hypothetical protein
MSRTTLLVAPVSCLSGFLEVDTAGGADGATVASVAGGASVRFCLALLMLSRTRWSVAMVFSMWFRP